MNENGAKRATTASPSLCLFLNVRRGPFPPMLKSKYGSFNMSIYADSNCGSMVFSNCSAIIQFKYIPHLLA